MSFQSMVVLREGQHGLRAAAICDGRVNGNYVRHFAGGVLPHEIGLSISIFELAVEHAVDGPA